jgi:Fuc2NAc and GlcNAc transferase
MQIALSVSTFVAALFLTGWFRRYALAQRMLDVQNERSSHAVATPRGGGLVIALTVVSALLLLGVTGVLPARSMWAMVGGSLAVAVIGFVDDRGHVAPRWRLLGHFTAAAWVVGWLGGLPPLPFFGVVLDLGWVGHTLAVLFAVWLLNLTNFMDGIDGIAAVEVITACVGGVLAGMVAASEGSWLVPVILASTTLGFLCWNWPPAKIFMGDVGSGFLGLMMAALALQAGWERPALFWAWVILLGAFVVDATITLARRVSRGEKFYVAHRSHAYQRAARRFGSHRPVTLAVGLINVAFLLPVALLVANGTLDGFVGVLLTYVPLAVVVWWIGGGTASD